MPSERPLSFSQIGNIRVVRDDIVPGGTKARFVHLLFNRYDHLIYATPSEGGAQTALSLVANLLGKKVTLYTAKRETTHPRVLVSKQLGAKVVEVEKGAFLPNLQILAEREAASCRLFWRERAHHLAFGLASVEVVNFIADTARRITPAPTELWFAAGSGTLAKGLAKAWPEVPRFAVQVGHRLNIYDVGGATVIRPKLKFTECEERPVPFNSDPNYDAKAWHCMLEHTVDKKRPVTFWNVAPHPEFYFDKTIKQIMATT